MRSSLYELVQTSADTIFFNGESVTRSGPPASFDVIGGSLCVASEGATPGRFRPELSLRFDSTKITLRVCVILPLARAVNGTTTVFVKRAAA